jgi:hypothetical protein
MIFRSNLSVDEILRRFEKTTRKVYFNSLFISSLVTMTEFEKEYFFSFKKNVIRLERVPNRNSYAPIFIGKILEKDNQVLIEGKIITRLYAKLFSIIWFSLAGIIGLIIVSHTLYNLLVNGSYNPDSLFIIFINFILIIFGYFLFRSMKIQAEKWKIEMITFLENTFETKGK